MIYHTVGFTGTRRGMTYSQIVRVTRLINMHQPQVVHHGDCIGADAQFHDICLACGTCEIVIHPPTNTSMRAYCKGATNILNPTAYLDRNKKIVNLSNFLIACPMQKEEQLRSGTWSTIRFAKKTDTDVVIIYP